MVKKYFQYLLNFLSWYKMIGVKMFSWAFIPAFLLATPNIPFVESNGEQIKDEKLAVLANKYLGTPYVWGGFSFDRGLDCSAFIKKLMKKRYNISLPRTAKSQALNTNSYYDITSFSNLTIGDAIYFKNKRGHIHHVALITGFDKNKNPIITHAKGEKYGVIKEVISKKYKDEFYIGKRFSYFSNKRSKDKEGFVPLLIKNL